MSRLRRDSVDEVGTSCWCSLMQRNLSREELATSPKIRSQGARYCELSGGALCRADTDLCLGESRCGGLAAWPIGPVTSANVHAPLAQQISKPLRSALANHGATIVRWAGLIPCRPRCGGFVMPLSRSATACCSCVAAERRSAAC